MNYKFLILLFLSVSSCKWSYDGFNNPERWGNSEKFKFCKIRYNQSPIDVKDEFTESDLKFFYKSSAIEKENENYVVKFVFDEKDFLMRGKKKYFLRYMYFHHPSEHLINSNQYPLELQIYHKSEDEQWLALSVFFEIGKENIEINKLTEFLLFKQSETKSDLSKIIKSDDKIFFYDGSFTTPPCKEGVKWYVMKTPIYISKEQMNKIIKLSILSKSNARPVQQFHPQ